MQVQRKTLSVISIVCTIIIIVLSILLGGASFTVGTALLLVGFPLLLLPVSFLVGLFSAWFNVKIAPEANIENGMDVVLDEELNITEYGPVIGKLDGNNFYEYIVVHQKEKDIRLEYIGPFNEKEGFTTIDEGWFVVLHDVLYLEPKIKEEVHAV